MTEESLSFYVKYDQLALSGKIVKILHSLGLPAPDKSFLLEKKPLLNNNNNIVGVLYHYLESPREFAAVELRKQVALSNDCHQHVSINKI